MCRASNASLEVFLPGRDTLENLPGKFSTTMAMLLVKTQEFGQKGSTGLK